MQNDTNLKVYTDGQSAEVYFKLSSQTLTNGTFKSIGTINSAYKPLYNIGVNGDCDSIVHSKVKISDTGLVQGRNIHGNQQTINFENTVVYKLANPLY